MCAVLRTDNRNPGNDTNAILPILESMCKATKFRKFIDSHSTLISDSCHVCLNLEQFSFSVTFANTGQLGNHIIDTLRGVPLKIAST